MWWNGDGEGWDVAHFPLSPFETCHPSWAASWVPPGRPQRAGGPEEAADASAAAGGGALHLAAGPPAQP